VVEEPVLEWSMVEGPMLYDLIVEEEMEEELMMEGAKTGGPLVQELMVER
jgi:hypothetical protein